MTNNFQAKKVVLVSFVPFCCQMVDETFLSMILLACDNVKPLSEETSVLPRANCREQPIMTLGLCPVRCALLTASL